MSFSQTAYQANRLLWQSSIQHPFIQQLRDGTLPEATFRYYLIQDHHYLRDFARVHDLTAQAAENKQVKQLLTDLANGLRAGEITTQTTFFKPLAITPADVRQTPMAPTTYAYTSHMYRTLSQAGPAAAIAGLLPCAWLYADIGAALQGVSSPVPVYQAWLDSYQAADYTDAVATQIELTDQVAAATDQAERAQMMAAFARSTYFELNFWQMALDQQQWQP
ncbi:thiaminase II [Furfurilactobacillus curtus]|uniref:Aminopyrimidine aminohydrolase n=1 Tax=Furfurilactobacillus curtus TaxID=1746200 RepID=A0ABQ5JRL2_9LACO